MKLHIATSRPIGERCKEWAKKQYTLTSMEDCEVFVSVLYDTIIKEDFIKGRRCYNFHPGVLPDYRGAGAYSWAILNHEQETGVTFHKIDKDIDHGEIIEIKKFIIKDKNAGELFREAEELIFKMFKKWLPLIIKREVKSYAVEEGHIYYRKDLEKAKDITYIKRAFTFPDKESAYYIHKGEKIYL